MAVTIYATEDDLKTRYGADEFERLSTKNPEAQAVGKALADASGEAASYIGVRYLLPLQVLVAPLPLVIATCDIARFRLWMDDPTDEVEARYKRAIEWLIQVSKGEAILMDENGEEPPLNEDRARPLRPRGHSRAQVFSDQLFNQMPDRRFW